MTTAPFVARLASRAVTFVVLLVSGTYLLVYLYRWEWNRAVISGIFFLAAELAVVTMRLSGRMARLERRLDEAAPAAPAPPEPAVDADRESPFAWLDPASGRLGVFVPVLMGAGVILSALAVVVEKVSGAVASAGRPAGPAGSVGPALPAGGLLGPPGPAPAVAARRSSRLVTAAAVAALAGLAVPALDLVADATQSRTDPSPDLTTVVVDVRTRDRRGSAADEAAVLWAACQGPARLDDVRITTRSPGAARLEASGVLGEHSRRKLTGCLADATLDEVYATVVRVDTRPAGGPDAREDREEGRP